MIKKHSIYYILMIISAVYGLYELKYNVRYLKKQSAKIEAELALKQQSIRVLRAEWAYLNRPERLQKLCDRYLKLKPLQSSQMITSLDINQNDTILYMTNY